MYIPVQPPPRHCRIEGFWCGDISGFDGWEKLAGWNLRGTVCRASKPGEVWVLDDGVLGFWNPYARIPTHRDRTHARTASSIAPPNPPCLPDPNKLVAPPPKKGPRETGFLAHHEHHDTTNQQVAAGYER